ncbi:uncharacterized protein LOC111704385 [Eurytemora carolleeae]|uniref:uncharacterized protein LOC111704385 n=1 Tax=Eurytemora carolleeae TaxID=1294199 RepID=UPI000C77A174|nr:uncharacterized protein LOC111704385 [Eurytemora carolleeae]|eukprot:XP_023332380.1 uncharacterized protein LOC111704385 [Eurytemora affinis]
MIDVWLIFSQSIPFFEVCLQTFIDSMREDDNREINHHGTSVPANENKNLKKKDELFYVRPQSLTDVKSNNTEPRIKLTQVNEALLVEARKDFYRKVSLKRMVWYGEFTVKFLIPIFIVIFSIVYWFYGLSHYLNEDYGV